MWFWKSPSSDDAPSIPKTPAASTDPSTCPVDHKTREIWLEEARSSRGPTQTPPSSQRSRNSPSQLPLNHPPLPSLSSDREVSTIPRAVVSAALSQSSYHSRSAPANAEQESEVDRKSGNWMYPSEKMFFDAMRRKQFDPQAEDMRSIVPIHNAVNERAWAEIKSWERPYDSSACGGPKLVSFQGSGSSFAASDASAPGLPGIWEVLTDKNLTPRAKWTVMMGAKPPFDRHDWVVERCKGQKVEYVIDFYSGKQGQGGNGLSFYLDVRPKLNTFEGWKMRASRTMGLS